MGKDAHRLVNTRNRSNKALKEVRFIKDGMVLINNRQIKHRWRRYFEQLLSAENPRTQCDFKIMNFGVVKPITPDEINEK